MPRTHGAAPHAAAVDASAAAAGTSMDCNPRTHLCVDQFTGNTMVQVRWDSRVGQCTGCRWPGCRPRRMLWRLRGAAPCALERRHTPPHTHPHDRCHHHRHNRNRATAALPPAHRWTCRAPPSSCTATCTSGTCACLRSSRCTTSAAGRSCSRVSGARAPPPPSRPPSVGRRRLPPAGAGSRAWLSCARNALRASARGCGAATKSCDAHAALRRVRSPPPPRPRQV